MKALFVTFGLGTWCVVFKPEFFRLEAGPMRVGSTMNFTCCHEVGVDKVAGIGLKLMSFDGLPTSAKSGTVPIPTNFGVKFVASLLGLVPWFKTGSAASTPLTALAVLTAGGVPFSVLPTDLATMSKKASIIGGVGCRA
jgi:hypothetical protein